MILNLTSIQSYTDWKKIYNTRTLTTSSGFEMIDENVAAEIAAPK